MKTLAIIQARMGSSRLPGKVLEDLAGMPVLAWVIRAARAIPGVDEVVVATSNAAADDRLARWCEENGVTHFLAVRRMMSSPASMPQRASLAQRR